MFRPNQTKSSKSKIWLMVTMFVAVQLSRRHGAPIDRRRLYIIMVRRDVLSDDALGSSRSDEDFTSLIGSRVVSMAADCAHDWILSSKSSLENDVNSFLTTICTCSRLVPHWRSGRHWCFLTITGLFHRIVNSDSREGERTWGRTLLPQ